MDQKIMKRLGAVIAVFAIIILVIFFITSCSGGNYTFERLEEKMLKVAKIYYENHEDELPSQDHDTKTLTLKKMISNGDIDELTELFDSEDIKCDGSITVTNNNGYYLYTPTLNCKNGKESYSTTLLKDKIIENSLTETGIGLYESGEQYIFKGEVKDNYIKLGENLYRIIRINEDGTIRLFKDEGVKQIIWDDRYNEEYHSNTGINEYIYNNINSRIKDSTENLYKEFNNSEKAYVVTSDVCIGKRTEADMTKDGSTECSQKLADQQFTSIATYEYLQATLETACNSTEDKVCKNYNWLSTYDYNIWTITADSEKSRYAFVLDKSLERHSCNSNGRINVVFNLDEKVPYTSGTGTLEDPYMINIEEQ